MIVKNKVILIIIALSFCFLTGCEPNNREIESLLDLLKNNKIVSNSINQIGTSSIPTGLFDSIPIYSNYYIYDDSGEMIAIFYSKPSNTLIECDYKVYISRDVISEYKDVEEFEYSTNTNVISKENVYTVNTDNESTYCIKSTKGLFGISKLEIIK